MLNGAERVELLPIPEIPLTNIQKNVLRTTRLWVEDFHIQATKEGRVVMGGHGMDQVQRVAGMAGFLAVTERYEPFLPILSALLADIGRTSLDVRVHTWQHGELSAEMARELLDSLSLPILDKELVQKAIEDHPKKNEEVRRSFVVELLQDADRLTSLGIIGIARAGATHWERPVYAEELGRSTEYSDINSIYHDLFRILEWYDMLWTATARKIAEPRVLELRHAMNQFNTEASFMHTAYGNLGI